MKINKFYVTSFMLVLSMQAVQAGKLADRDALKAQLTRVLSSQVDSHLVQYFVPSIVSHAEEEVSPSDLATIFALAMHDYLERFPAGGIRSNIQFRLITKLPVILSAILPEAPDEADKTLQIIKNPSLMLPPGRSAGIDLKSIDWGSDSEDEDLDMGAVKAPSASAVATAVSGIEPEMKHLSLSVESHDVRLMSPFGYSIRLISNLGDLNIENTDTGRIIAKSSGAIIVYINDVFAGKFLHTCGAFGRDTTATSVGGDASFVAGEKKVTAVAFGPDAADPDAVSKERKIEKIVINEIAQKFGISDPDSILDMRNTGLAMDGGIVVLIGRAYTPSGVFLYESRNEITSNDGEFVFGGGPGASFQYRGRTYSLDGFRVQGKI